MKRWNVLSSEYVVENCPYGRVRRDKCQLPNGLTMDSYINEYPNWVNAVVLTQAGELVMVFQYRHGIGDFTLEIPGGTVDDGENPLKAIVREVAEETGYQSSEPPYFLGEFFPNPAIANNRIRTYLFQNAEPLKGQHLDNTEDIHIRLIPFDVFGQMIKSGKAPQMSSAMGYYLVKEFYH